jgi:hypothetical protein
MKPKPTDAVNEELKTDVRNLLLMNVSVFTGLTANQLEESTDYILELLAQEANKARIEELRNLPYINPEWETFEYINERIAELKVIQNKLEGLQDE